MTLIKRFSLCSFMGLIVLIAGCASTPTIENATEPTLYPHPVETVHAASLSALTVTGFDVKKDEENYIEGFRPRKVGLFVGSGGETVGIWLTEQSSDSTQVRVQTAKSFVGGLGQKNWDTKITEEIQNYLNKE